MNALVSMPCEPAGEDPDARHVTQASAEAMVRSKSYASLRHRPSHANVFNDPSARQSLKAFDTIRTLDDFQREPVDVLQRSS